MANEKTSKRKIELLLHSKTALSVDLEIFNCLPHLIQLRQKLGEVDYFILVVLEKSFAEVFGKQHHGVKG